MGKEQWGHGYHTGLRAHSNKKKLIGKFFHSYINDRIECQGYIKGIVQKGVYMVQYLSWFDGCETVQKIIKIKEMKNWTFYDTLDDMNFEYRKKQNLVAVPERSKKF